jgi:hypothetical protein
MSLFWPPSLRICDGSHPLAARPPSSGSTYCVNVKVAESVRATGSKPGALSRSIHPRQPTFCNKIRQKPTFPWGDFLRKADKGEIS